MSEGEEKREEKAEGEEKEEQQKKEEPSPEEKEKEPFEKSNIIKFMYQTIEKVLSGQNGYSAALVNDWTDSIVDLCLNYFKQDPEKYKYFANCTIIESKEREKLGFHTQCGVLAESNKDNTFQQRWESKNMMCVLVVFRVSFG